MPRVRRRGHKRNEKYSGSNLTRSELLRALVDGWGPLKTDNPLLESAQEADRPAIIKQAWELHFSERAARREPVLRERLLEWGVDGWGSNFSEMPHLEKELTEEQASRWAAFLERVRRDRLRETQGNVIAMQPKAPETIQ